MTKEEIIQIIRDCEGGFMIPADIKIATADRILAALEKEREGEVVLCKGRIDFAGWTDCNGPNCGGKQIGKRGQLIFRPTPSEKEGV